MTAGPNPRRGDDPKAAARESRAAGLRKPREEGPGHQRKIGAHFHLRPLAFLILSCVGLLGKSGTESKLTYKPRQV